MFFPSLFKRDARDYDLRHFKWIQWSDAWDGCSIASDGATTEVLLYQGKRMYEITKVRVGCSREATARSGNESILAIESVARAYMRILRIARHLSGVEAMAEFCAGVSMGSAQHATLVHHPQYLELIEVFKQSGWSVELQKSGEFDYTVVVRKT